MPAVERTQERGYRVGVDALLTLNNKPPHRVKRIDNGCAAVVFHRGTVASLTGSTCQVPCLKHGSARIPPTSNLIGGCSRPGLATVVQPGPSLETRFGAGHVVGALPGQRLASRCETRSFFRVTPTSRSKAQTTEPHDKSLKGLRKSDGYSHGFGYYQIMSGGEGKGLRAQLTQGDGA